MYKNWPHEDVVVDAKMVRERVQRASPRYVQITCY